MGIVFLTETVVGDEGDDVGKDVIVITRDKRNGVRNGEPAFQKIDDDGKDELRFGHEQRRRGMGGVELGVESRTDISCRAVVANDNGRGVGVRGGMLGDRFTEPGFTGDIAGHFGIRNEERDTAMALAQKGAGSMPADGVIIDIEGRQVDLGMTRSQNQRGHGMSGKPLLDIQADREQHTAEHSILTHKYLEFAVLRFSAAGGADEKHRSEPLFGQMGAHLAGAMGR